MSWQTPRKNFCKVFLVLNPLLRLFGWHFVWVDYFKINSSGEVDMGNRQLELWPT